MMVTEQTAKRIADALERLERVLERLDPALDKSAIVSGVVSIIDDPAQRPKFAPRFGPVTMERTQGADEVVYRAKVTTGPLVTPYCPACDGGREDHRPGCARTLPSRMGWADR